MAACPFKSDKGPISSSLRKTPDMMGGVPRMFSSWRAEADAEEWESQVKFSSLSCTGYKRHGMSSGTVISSIIIKDKIKPE